MGVILLCSRCSNSRLLHAGDEGFDLLSLARQHRWQRLQDRWICPNHAAEIEDELLKDYEAALGEFTKAVQEFKEALTEGADLPMPDSLCHGERAFKHQEVAYSNLQAARERFLEFRRSRDGAKRPTK